MPSIFAQLLDEASLASLFKVGDLAQHPGSLSPCTISFYGVFYILIYYVMYFCITFVGHSVCRPVECKLRGVYWPFFSFLGVEHCQHLVCAQQIFGEWMNGMLLRTRQQKRMDWQKGMVDLARS